MDIYILAQRFYDHSRYMRGYSEYTIKRYQGVINYFLKFADIKYVEQINEQNTRELFMHGRIDRKWSTNTFIVYHKSLTVFFRWCMKSGYMTSDPIADIEMPRLEKKIPPKLTKQEAFKLLEVSYNYPYDYRFLRYRNHAIFSMFIFAGLRRKELLSLKLTDVDLDNLTIFVRLGKGNKDRVVPMSYTLADTLKKYLGERKRLNKTCPEFFSSLNRNCGFTESGLKWLVKKMKDASGIKFSTHKLRHTFATLMLEGGCDIYSLSKMMGHSDIKTTTIYLAASTEHLRAQIVKHPLNK